MGAADCHQDQHHGDIGRGIGQNAGRIGDGDPLPLSRAEIDMIQPDRIARDYPQRWRQRRDKISVDPISWRDDEGIGLSQQGKELRRPKRTKRQIRKAEPRPDFALDTFRQGNRGDD
jgi:hypothetical protein